jgi:hypothetical protein
LGAREIALVTTMSRCQANVANVINFFFSSLNCEYAKQNTVMLAAVGKVRMFEICG